MQVNIYEAKTRLSALLDKAHAGEEIVIARAGKPVARLCPWQRPAAAAAACVSAASRHVV